jgi:hypothetical protein
MAQRYGGKFSPTPPPDDGQRPAFHAKRRSRAGGRVNFLFFAPVIFALKAFTGPPAALGWNLAALGLLIAAETYISLERVSIGVYLAGRATVNKIGLNGVPGVVMEARDIALEEAK